MDGEKLVQNIRAIAIQKKIQMKDLYVMAGITSGALSQWKSGKTKPHTATLSRIANVLNVTLQELLKGTEKAPSAYGGEGRSEDGYSARINNEEDEDVIRREILSQIYDSLSPADRKTLADFAQNLALSRGLHAEESK